MVEGEVKLIGDIIYCLDNGFYIQTAAYLPDEAYEELRKADDGEDDEDMGDMEDWLAEADALEETLGVLLEEEHVPSFSPNYRGALVVQIPHFVATPRFKLLSKATRARLCDAIRAYLLSQGFAEVKFWDTDQNVIE